MMVRAATSRLKVNPPLGRMPVLQFLAPAELQVDAAYQRSIESAGSQTLIRKMAVHWNWDLCLPLVVSRRRGGAGGDEYFVIDGQHRLGAARLRRDIDQLPCMVKEYASAGDEAASFVHLNQQRQPLTKLDLFKAAVASEDPQACAMLAAIEAAGLRIAPHSNYTAWKPGMVSNVPGIERAWRTHGEAVTRRALDVLSAAFAGQVLRYAGTIFPGIVAICAEDGDDCELAQLCDMLASRSQKDWRAAMMQARATNPNLKYQAASVAALSDAWDEWLGAALAEDDDADGDIADLLCREEAA